MKRRLIIYSGKAAHSSVPTESDDYLLFWNESPIRATESSCTGHEIDFLARLEADNLANREKYLEWIHNLGATKTRGGKNVAQALQLDEATASFWWLSLIAEKSPLKSSAILEAFKLMSLERLQRDYQFQSVVLVTASRTLAACVRHYCAEVGASFQCMDCEKTESKPFAKRLPHSLRAIFWLCREFVLHVRMARRHRLITPRKNSREAAIISYFPNFESHSAQQGIFRSRYWQHLHDWLAQQTKLTINWVWIYVGSAQASYAETCRYRQRFQAMGKDNFYLLEEFLKPVDFFLAFFIYVRVMWRGWRLRRKEEVRAAFALHNSSLNFLPLFCDEWAKSFWGATAMENCLWQRKISRVLEAFSARQEWALYLCEFQAWEKILAKLWKTQAAHGALIGYQHATVGGLMLNYFHDRRTYEERTASSLPRPDFIAVNGPLTRCAFVEQGYPAKEVVEVEALRYRYINACDGALDAPLSSPRKRLLVAGDYLLENSRRQLRMLSDALSVHPREFDFEKIWIKPHPFCPVGNLIAEYDLSARVEVVDGAIGDYLPRASHVFAANSTSVALEALAMGKHAASCVSLNELNLSPLLGLAEGSLVRNVVELVEFMRLPVKVEKNGHRYFNFDRPISSLLTRGLQAPYGIRIDYSNG